MRRCLQIHPEHASRCEKDLRHRGQHVAWGTTWSGNVFPERSELQKILFHFAVGRLLLLALMAAPFVIVAANLIAR